MVYMSIQGQHASSILLHTLLQTDQVLDQGLGRQMGQCKVLHLLVAHSQHHVVPMHLCPRARQGASAGLWSWAPAAADPAFHLTQSASKPVKHILMCLRMAPI